MTINNDKSLGYAWNQWMDSFDQLANSTYKIFQRIDRSIQDLPSKYEEMPNKGKKDLYEKVFLVAVAAGIIGGALLGPFGAALFMLEAGAFTFIYGVHTYDRHVRDSAHDAINETADFFDRMINTFWSIFN
jgi:hypothetical protein